MLRFESIIFNNWGPFYGRNDIRTDAQNIFIYAHRAYGKSRMRQGMSLLLFNDIRVTESKARVVDYLNIDAVLAKDHKFFIEANLIDTETKDTYKIAKHIEIDAVIENYEELKTRYENDDPKITTYFTKNGNESENPEKAISELFPETLLDFFFIHGDVLKQRHINVEHVKRDVEAMLGITQLKLLAQLSKTLFDERLQALRLQKKRSGDPTELNEKIASAREKVTSLHDEKERLTVDLQNDSDEVQKVDSKLRSFNPDAKEAMDGLSTTEQDLATAKAEIPKLSEKCLKIGDEEDYGQIWKAYALEKILSKHKKDAKYGNLDINFANTLDAVIRDKTDLYQTLDSHTQESLEKLLKENPEILKLKDHSFIQGYMSKNEHYEKFKERVKELADMMSNIRDLEDDKKRYKQQLESLEMSDKAKQEEFKGLTGEKKTIDGLITSNKKRLEEIPGEIEIINNGKEGEEGLIELEKRFAAADIDKTNKNELLAKQCGHLEEIVKNAIANFRKKNHDKFSKILNQKHDLIKAPEDKNLHLELTDKYQTSLVTTSGDIQEGPADSQVYCASLALTIALSEMSHKQLPYFIDNPFEQLGLKKVDRAMMIGSWKHLNQQVIIVSQTPDAKDDPYSKGELDKKFNDTKHWRLIRDKDKGERGQTIFEQIGK